MLTHRTWINLGILYIKVDKNYILNARAITEKLINKSNWISELSTVKKAIPKIRLTKLQSNTTCNSYQINCHTTTLKKKKQTNLKQRKTLSN